MSSMKHAVVIQLVTWNGEKYIPFLFESLRSQKFSDWKLYVLDNGSVDGTVSALKSASASLKQQVVFIEKDRNIGFASGHNELFRHSLGEAPYVLLLNQDTILNPNFLDKLYYFAESHPDVGSLSGRLMKWAFPDKTSVVDSLGLEAFRNHRVIDTGGGLVWEEKDDDIVAKEVFGVSGALPLYRSFALQEVSFNEAVFDEDFFSYKEDVDLAWRLRSAGWSAFTVMDAVAFHDRSSSGPFGLSDRDAIRNRKNKSKIANLYSYRNHLMMLVKNYHFENGIRGFFSTAWYELKKAVFILVTAPHLFISSWTYLINNWSHILKKRDFISKKRSTSFEELSEWFSQDAK